MPELKEVFDMVTKQTEPDVDSWKEQERRQRRIGQSRRVGAFALVAAIAAVAVVIASIVMRPAERDRTGGPSQIRGDATVRVLDLDTGITTTLPASLDGGSFYVVSPSGDELAFAPWPAPVGDDARLRIYIGNVDGTGVRRVTPEPAAMDEVNPRWSPDGDAIVFQGRDARTEEVGNLYLLDPVSGTTTELTDFPFRLSHHWFMSPSFRPDGQVILFNVPREGPNDQASLNDQIWDLWTIPSAGGEPTLLRRNAAHGSYSPSGTTIAYLRGPLIEGGSFGADSIWLADADGTDPRLLVEGTHLAWPRWSPDGTRIAYEQEGGVYVIEVATGETSRVVAGSTPEWLDAHTLIFSP